VRFTFPVPNNVAAITNKYIVAYSTIGVLGSVESFDTHLVHQGQVGETPITNEVTIPGVGSTVDINPSFVVGGNTDCKPCLSKKVIGKFTAVAPGQTLQFDVFAENKSSDPTADLTLLDTATFQEKPDDPTTTLTSWAFDIGVLAPGAKDVRSISLSAPWTPGTLTNTVACAGADPADVTIRVLDGDPNCKPCVEKKLSGGKVAITPGEYLTFTITAWNNGDTPLAGVLLTDTATLDGAVVSTQTIDMATIPPHEARQRTIAMVAPTSPGVFENTVACPTCIDKGGKVSRPVRRPVINEVVVEPQHDWNNDGPGGDGVPFNDAWGTSAPGSAYVTIADQWVEILTNTGSPDELRDWTLEFTDTFGVSRSVTLGTNNMHFFGVYVVVGDLGGIARDSVVTLRDGAGDFVDTVDLKAIQAQKDVGYATGVDDESVVRSPNGSVGTKPALFKRGAATIGRPNE
jgi:hypothetical protein